MKILVVGNGGRTHVLAQVLAASPGAREVYVAPGNDGMVRSASLLALEPSDAAGLASWAAAARVDLVVCGDPSALDAGLAEAVEAAREGAEDVGPRAICPTTAAAERLDNAAWVAAVVRERGVALATEAEGADADAVLTLLALADGATARGLGLAWSYRRLAAGGRGPLTEGMGAEAPPPAVPPAATDWLEHAVARPLVAALAAGGIPYRGFLYVEALIEPEGRGTPRILGVSPGLPPMATQAILPLLKTDLLLLLVDVAEGTLGRDDIALTGEAACAVTLVSEGYPDIMAYETGYGILGLDAAQPRTVAVLHEATRDPYRPRSALVVPREMARREGAGSGLMGLFSFGKGRKERADAQARRGAGDPFSRLVTAGGRVLTVVARGATAEEARRRAYEALDPITFTGRSYRTDIGKGPPGSTPAADLPAGRAMQP